MREVRTGQIYRHFKDKMYQIVCVAKHSETGEKLVIYQKLYDDYAVHARPYEMFLSEVDHDKYPEVKQKYRFELVEPVEADSKVDNVSIDSASSEENMISEHTAEEEVGEGCNNDLIAFLDAETYEEKHNLLVSMKNRLTDRLIDDIAASMDVMVDEGDLNKRYKSLLTCIDTKAKFEIMR
ncbi:MAG: DUF1653 domain-containing protein [Lachnospiraceae bacterium]|nr:DUF1653 domain-containing protein [Lachnospiraceae bacterium]